MPRQQVHRWQFDFPVSPERLWPYVSDTQRVQRFASIWSAEYRYQPLAGGGSEVHARARAKGLMLEWVEQPTEWQAPERFRIVRDYRRGPLSQLISEVQLEALLGREATRVTHTATLVPKNNLAAAITWVANLGVGRSMKRAYAEVGRWLASGELPKISGAQSTQARARAERLLAERAYPQARRLGAEIFYGHLAAYLCRQPGDEIASLAPFALADRWKQDRQKALRFFLHATRSGAFDLHYNLICPSCRQAKTIFTELAEVKEEGHCPSCNIDFGVDFDRSVEVRFSPRPLGLDAEAVAYCHAGPQRTPHRLTSWVLEGGARREVSFSLEPGSYLLSSLQCKGAVYFDAVADDDEDAAAEAKLELAEGGVSGMPQRLRAGKVMLSLENAMAKRAQLHVARADWADDAASAAHVTALQEFRDLFSSEILAPGAEFALRNLTFLFSDLVGSTALYEQIGDAAAFALVRDHFELLKQIYLRHDGTLVKTIGDAVMAVFTRPVDALEAALEMHQRIASLKTRGEAPIALRIGLHRGPCIAMEANGVVDYFGTTVNLAARVQGQAGAHEIALSPAMLEDSELVERMDWVEASARSCQVALKGLTGQYQLSLLSCSPRDDE